MQTTISYPPRDYSLVTKTNTCNTTGAQTDNIFTITGCVQVLELWAECTEATNATTLSTCYFDMYDGTSALELTDNAGTDCSAITVGSVILKSDVATAVLTKLANGAGALLDGAANTTRVFCPFIMIKKTGVATYIRFCFTGDASTDVDLKFYVKYLPVSADGSIAAV